MTYICIGILILSFGTDLARGATPPPGSGSPTITLYSANSTLGAQIGRPVNVEVNITGGYTIGANGQFGGYVVRWFWGEANGTKGDLNNTVKVVPLSDIRDDPTNSCNTNAQTVCKGFVSINATIVYNQTGSFDISVTVYDSRLDFTIDTIVIQAQRNPFIAMGHCNAFGISGTPKTCVVGENEHLEFSATACTYNPLTTVGVPTSCPPQQGKTVAPLWNWSTGDGNFPRFSTYTSGFGGYSIVPYYWYSQAGTYEVTATARDPSTGYVARSYITVIVKNPQADLSCVHQPPSAPIGVPVTLSVMPNDTYYGPHAVGGNNSVDVQNLSYNWTFGDGTSSWGSNVTTHVYTAAGSYVPSVAAVDEDGLAAASPPPSMCGNHLVNVTGGPSPPSGTHNIRAAVGQTVFLSGYNASGLNASTPFVNYTWQAPQGTNYGFTGRDQDFRPGNHPASLTTSGTYISTVRNSTNVQFYDVTPTVGVDSIYTQASITVSISNTYYYSNLNFTLLENGVNQGWYNMSYPQSSVSFDPLNFQMANSWKVVLQYTPYGQSGGTYVSVAWNWQNDNTYTDNYDATEPSDYSDTTSVWFSNSNTSHQNTVPVSVNQAALGEPFTMYVVFFSPAQTNLTETWTMGDGTVYNEHDSAPSTPHPTMSTWSLQYAYYTGSNYAFSVKACDNWGRCGWDNITMNQLANFTASDTAPFVSLQPLGSKYAEEPLDLSASVTNQDLVNGNVTHAYWQFGDLTTAAGATVVHVYQYAGRYAAVAYASSQAGHLGIRCPPVCGGSISANWSWITIVNPPPIAQFSMPGSGQGGVNGGVAFNASQSQDDFVRGSSDLSYSWNFGDGLVFGGTGFAGMGPSHAYSARGTYTVRLTVADSDGRSATVTKSLTITGTPPTASLSNRLLLVDRFYPFSLNLSIPSIPIPYVNVTWVWGDGTPNGYGINPGHTYFAPCTCSVSATIVGGPFSPAVTVHSTARVVDLPSLVDFPYVGEIVYGENHTASFTAMAVGLLDDISPSYGNNAYSFVWSWGDGSPTASSSGANISTQGHVYVKMGVFQLNVSVTAPYGNVSVVSIQINSIPDPEGEGLPSAYKELLGANPYFTDTFDKIKTFYGQGLTDFIRYYLPNLGQLQQDLDQDGLTTMQELLGSQTGFPSNPLDPNTAGDGIPDGRHVFTQTFMASQSVPFTPVNCSIYLPIPNVYYSGQAPSFNDSKVSYSISPSTNNEPTSDFSLSLVDPYGGIHYLPAFTASTALTGSFDLMNNTPLGGPKINTPGMAMDLFMQPGTWSLVVSHYSPICNSGSPSYWGNVSSAAISITYYTNPALADPTHQGMLEGPTLVTNLFNCSAPQNEYYWTFNPSQLLTNPGGAFTKTYFWPYTQAYYKLSVAQGVPYAPVHNSSMGIQNNGTYNSAGSPCTGTSSYSGLSAPTASIDADGAAYLGDADFGISPDSPNAAGDLGLTNGMKALGAGAYNLTAGHYLTTGGGRVATPGVFYPADLIGTYFAPLNPTSFSTAGDGIADSASPDPVAPLEVGVSISQAEDPNCYVGAPTLYTPSDLVTATITSDSSQPTVITPTDSFPLGGSTSCTQPTNGLGGNAQFDYYYHSGYLMPADNNQWSFTLNLSLWNQDQICFSPGCGPVPYAWIQHTYALKPNAQYYTSTPDGVVYGGIGGYIDSSIVVQPLNRAPTILVNGTGDVRMIPGYGPRFEGDQQFYMILLNVYGGVGGGTDPFQNGLNTIIVSRYALFQSGLGQFLTNANSIPSSACYNNATLMARGNQSSDAAVVGTLYGNVTDACAESMLLQLTTGSNGKNVDGFIPLTSTQTELLGLVSDALGAVPFNNIPGGYNSPQGPPPQTLWTGIGNFVVSALKVVIGAIIALGVIILFTALKAIFGQKFAEQVLGPLLDAFPVIQAIMSALAAIANAFISAIEAIFTAFLNLIIHGTLYLVGALLICPNAFALASELYQEGQYTGSNPQLQFSQTLSSMSTFYSCSPAIPSSSWPPESLANAQAHEQQGYTNVTILVLTMGVLDSAVAVAADAISGGGATVADDLAHDAESDSLQTTANIVTTVTSTAGSVALSTGVLSGMQSGNSNTVLGALSSVFTPTNNFLTWFSGTFSTIADTYSLLTDFSKSASPGCWAVDLTFTLVGLEFAGISAAAGPNAPPALQAFGDLVSIASGAATMACAYTPASQAAQQTGVAEPDIDVLGLFTGLGSVLYGFAQLSGDAAKF